MRFVRLIPGRKGLCAVLLLVPLEAFALLVAAADDGRRGVVEVQDDEVAVRYDHLRREHEIVDEPGYVPYLPWFGEVLVLDKSPKEFRFEGLTKHDQRRVPRLTVRARDGSSYGFETLTVQYALEPSRAAEALSDSGPGDTYKLMIVNAYARGVLRDEFGRWTAEEIVRPQTLVDVVTAGKERLDELIGRHGLRVLHVSTPQPKFDAKYEGMVERRKVANQEVEHLRAKIRQLEEERSHLVSGARRKKELEIIALEGAFEQRLEKAERAALQVRVQADIDHDRRVADGEFERSQLEQRARAIEARARSEADALVAELETLKARGADAVRAALVDRLAHIEFELKPVPREVQIQRVGEL